MNEIQISKITGIEKSECSCKDCVKMCKTAPCIGTPEEMAAIINAGFEKKVAITVLAAPIVKGTFGVPTMKVVSPLFDNNKKKCVFLNDKDKCKLHDLGLKPSEGKFANCTLHKANESKLSPLQLILLSWKDYQNII